MTRKRHRALRAASRAALGIALTLPGGFAHAQVMRARAVPAAATGLTVTTASAAMRQGTVTIAGIVWQCAASSCSAPAASQQPTLQLCQALSREIGAVRTFGSPAAQLDATQVSQCNATPAGAGTQAMIAGVASVIPGAAPTATLRRVATGELTVTGRRIDSRAVTTGELTMTGRRFDTRAVTTGELTVTGRRIAVRSVTTGELTMTGRR